MDVRKRLSFWLVILARPVWYWVVIIPFAGLSAFTLVRDEFLANCLPEQSCLKERLQTLNWLTGWPWYIWIIIALAVLILVVLESAYRQHNKARVGVKELEAQKPTVDSSSISQSGTLEDPIIRNAVVDIILEGAPEFGSSASSGFPKSSSDGLWLKVNAHVVYSNYIDPQAVSLRIEGHNDIPVEQADERMDINFLISQFWYFNIPTSVNEI